MKIMGNYDVNYVVEVSSSTEVYIAVNYHSLQSFIPWETQCFGPVYPRAPSGAIAGARVNLATVQQLVIHEKRS